MSGTTPPGTQWLRGQMQRKKRRRQAAKLGAAAQDISQGDQLLIDQFSDQTPALGAWQFQLSPSGDGQYDVIGSSPSEGDWGSPLNDSPMPLNDAVQAIQNYRSTASDTPGA